MKSKYVFLTVIIIVLAVAGYIALYQSKANTNSGGSKSPAAGAVSSDTVKLGLKSVYFLTDEKGMTLYHSINDFAAAGKITQSNCLGSCITMWPPFYVDHITVSKPLNASDFTTFTRLDGKKQTAWRRFPLYYYSGDYAAGDTNGQDIGNAWYMGIDPNYKAPAKTK